MYSANINKYYKVIDVFLSIYRIYILYIKHYIKFISVLNVDFKINN